MIEVLNLQPRYWVDRRKFGRILARLAEKYGFGDPDITLAFVGTRTITKLNRKFLKRDGPTDVLSFPGVDKGGDGKRHLGDIIISVPQAFRQSFAEAHGLETELLDLTVHGFLHLIGLDHGKGIEEEEVRVREALEGGV
ncbi:MAG TPA: rRNA maturation RNase YbeY [Candidatus Aminicenantes bacterium]|jgi:rRNA maturation RNase YbeY|nr:rRNA maturation RNase YbeY [Candidatus Aminicenantes bacterium]